MLRNVRNVFIEKALYSTALALILNFVLKIVSQGFDSESRGVSASGSERTRRPLLRKLPASTPTSVSAPPEFFTFERAPHLDSPLASAGLCLLLLLDLI